MNDESRNEESKCDRQDRKALVRFPELEEELVTVVEEILNREDLTEEDYSRLWFSNEEYAVLKQETRLDCLENERGGVSSQDGGLLTGVFVEKCREAQDKLNRWAIDCPGRRGLEKTACQGLGDARQSAQFQAIMDVLRYQDEMLIDKGKVDAEEVRKVSLRATKVARHFARMMAKADAFAIDADMGESMRDLGFGDSLRDIGHNERSSEHQRSSRKKSRPTKHKSHSPVRNPLKNHGDSLLGPMPGGSLDKKEKKKLVKQVTKMIEKEVKLKVKEEKQKAKMEKQKAKEGKKEETLKAKMEKQKARDGKKEETLKAKMEKQKAKEDKVKDKAKRKEKKPKLKVEDPTPREEKSEAKETAIEDKNTRQTLKQKFMDTKAGIIARIPRIR